MASIAALVEQRSDQHELTRALSGVADVRCFGAIEPLLALLRARGNCAVVLEIANRPEANLAHAITEVKSAAPNLPIVVWFRPWAGAFRALPSAFATGGRIECRLRGYDNMAETIRHLSGPSWEPGPAASLVNDLLPAVLPSLRTFFTVCLVRPSPNLAIHQLMEWIDEKERTIRDRLRRVGPIAPAMIRGYAAALHAAWLLDRKHLRPGQVAAALHFPNDRALRLNLKTYAQLTPDQLRAQGGFGLLRQHFRELLLGHELPRGPKARGHRASSAGRTVPRVRDRALPLSPAERELVLAAGIGDVELAQRVRTQPVAGSWSLVPLNLAELGVLFDTACRAAEADGPSTTALSRLVALRILRLMHGLPALPDPPLPSVPPPFLSSVEAARLFHLSR